MTDTNSLRTGAGYALGVGLYATHGAMTEAADTIDALRAENTKLREALAELAEYVDERTADNECRPLENARAALAATKTGEQHDHT